MSNPYGGYNPYNSAPFYSQFPPPIQNPPTAPQPPPQMPQRPAQFPPPQPQPAQQPVARRARGEVDKLPVRSSRLCSDLQMSLNYNAYSYDNFYWSAPLYFQPGCLC
jgi:hypothetical protein